MAHSLPNPPSMEYYGRKQLVGNLIYLFLDGEMTDEPGTQLTTWQPETDVPCG